MSRQDLWDIATDVLTYADGFKNDKLISSVEIADYTGPFNKAGHYDLQTVRLDIQGYVLKSEDNDSPRRNINQTNGDELPKANILHLPNVTLNETWSSLIYEDSLPSRLLRYLVRMISMVSRPGLNLSTFNWNRLCLLHGPPGSGKSTLCRALAQKLSIRLGSVFERSILVDINANAMLSKYFGESGKLIGTTFERVHKMAQDRKTLVCVVMDEVETIAGSRTNSTSGAECGDGLRATNQLLTALDRLRNLPNIVIICTSNLIDAIDPAFLDRVDIKQLIPSPSPAAIYNIFRSCVNELVRSTFVDAPPVSTTPTPADDEPTTTPAIDEPSSSSSRRTTRSQAHIHPTPTKPSHCPSSMSSPSPTTPNQTPISTFAEMQIRYAHLPGSPAARLWALAQRCQGLSGRTLRRLPILGLAMYTWGGDCGLLEAVSALEAAVEQEMVVFNRVKGGGKGDVSMGGT